MRHKLNVEEIISLVNRVGRSRMALTPDEYEELQARGFRVEVATGWPATANGTKRCWVDRCDEPAGGVSNKPNN